MTKRIQILITANWGRPKTFIDSIFLCAFLALIALLWVQPAPADGVKLRISYSDMRAKGRPGDFYKLGFAADASVCNDALQRLNRPMTMPPNLKMPRDYAKVDTAFFLGTEANLGWEPRWLIFENGTGGAGILDIASADIFNDGQPLQLLRFELGVGRGVIHSIYAGSPEQLREHLSESDNREEGRRIATLMDPVYRLEPFQLDFHPSFAAKELHTTEFPWAGVFADIVEVDGKTYVLVTSAVERYRHNWIYLLEFSSYKARRLVCGFQTEYEFIDE